MKENKFNKPLKKDPEIIGFVIIGNEIIVTNPCTIPIKLLTKELKK